MGIKTNDNEGKVEMRSRYIQNGILDIVLVSNSVINQEVKIVEDKWGCRVKR